MPGVTYCSICFQTCGTEPSETSIIMMSPLSAASSMPKSVSPSTQPSFFARNQLEFAFVLLRWPTITLNPLSRMLSAWPGPWMP